MPASTGIVLTGATGFLGRRVLRRLLVADVAVLAIHRPSSPARSGADATEQLSWHRSDHLLPDAFLKKHTTIVVIHAATSYGRQGQSIADVTETNLLLPLRVMDQLNRRGIEYDFINFGTSIPALTNVYSFSKHQFAQWLRLLADANTTLRALNLVFHYVYGADETGPKFSARLIDACRNRDAEFPMTSGTQSRDFIHVDDAADAVLAVLKNRMRIPLGYTAMDVGTGRATLLKDFAESAIRISGAPTVAQYDRLPPRHGEPSVLVANTTPLTQLGWVARIDVETGLRSIFREH